MEGRSLGEPQRNQDCRAQSRRRHHVKLLSATRVCLAAVGIVTNVVSIRGQSSAVGQWGSVFSMPLVSVHAAAMRSGEVLLFDAWEFTGTPSASLWNPQTNTYTQVPNSFTELFCAGHVLASDGRLITIGGHNGAGVGTRDVTAFDPVTRQWTPLADLIYARWYPTAVELTDGRILALGGAISRPANAEIPELYNRTTNAWAALPAAQKNIGEYPRAFLLPNGKFFVAEMGPARQTWQLDVNAQTWTLIGQSPASTGAAAMYQPGKIMMAGGGTNGADPVSAATGVLDVTVGSPSWRTTESMAFGRSQHNLVILPDGKVLVVGGATEISLTTTSGVLTAEMWDPADEAWTTMASMTTPRLYHSVAALLSDGRVLAAGGGRLDPAIDHLDGELYSPPYLFRGSRPTISSAPASVPYNAPFVVSTPDAASIARVTLVRASSVTHGMNVEQRFIELGFTPGSGSVTVQAPANPGLAPSGYYLLFLLNGNDVPSGGRPIRLEGAPTGPTLSVSDRSIVEGTGGANPAAVFSVAVTSTFTSTITVNYATAAGTATAGSDYVATSGTLTFPSGTTARTISVSITPDSVTESNETFTVVLSNPINATISDGSGLGTILDDDAPVMSSISINDVSATEGTGGGAPIASFTVTLTPASPQPVTVNFSTLPGTAIAPADYGTTSGLLTFGPGTTIQTVQVPIVADAVGESNETFTVELSNPNNAVLQDPIGTCTIIDDDSMTVTFQVAASGDDVNEDGAWFDSGGASIWLGTGATPTASYTGLRFTGVTIPRGATILSSQLEVNTASTQWTSVQADVSAEAVGNSAPFAATSRPSQRSLLSSPMVHTSDVQWAAGTWYSFSVIGGHPGHDPGIAPLIQAVVNQATWNPGNALSLVVRGTGGAWGRKFTRSVEAGPSTAPRLVVAYAGGQVSGSTLSINDVSVTEGTGGTTTANFSVTLAPASTQTVTVDYATVGGTATPGSDYTAASATLTFPAGMTTRTVSVSIATDSAAEPTETFTVVLSNPTSATIGDGTGVGTITDDDSGTITVTFSVTGGANDVNEDGTSLAVESASVWLGNGASAASFAGLRFVGISIPRGATIVSASLEVNAATTQWIPIALELRAEAGGNSAAFSATSRPSQRALVAPLVTHSSNVQWVVNTWYGLDDIATVLQAVVNQASWTSGNALSLIVRGTGGAWGRKFAQSVEGNPALAPRLIVTYSGGT